jgi:hypothetical protein
MADAAVELDKTGDLIKHRFRLIARSVLELAFYDIRMPKLCTKCGRTGSCTEKSLNLGWTERDRARAFLTSDRVELWAQVAGFDAEELKRGATAFFRKYRIVCGCRVEDRTRDCPKIEKKSYFT